MTNKSKIWMDGKLVNWEDANVHILTHGLHYGGGVFEGIRIYNTGKGKAIFRLQDHMVRFYNSAKVIWLNIPFSMDELCEASKAVVRPAAGGRLPQAAGLLRANPEGKIGLNPTKMPTKVSIACTHMGAYMGKEQLESGAKIITSTWEKPKNRSAMLNAKICGNYINSVVAKLEAVHRGFDEALMLNATGKWRREPARTSSWSRRECCTPRRCRPGYWKASPGTPSGDRQEHGYAVVESR